MHTINRKKKNRWNDCCERNNGKAFTRVSEKAKEMALTIYGSFAVVVFAMIRDLKRVPEK